MSRSTTRHKRSRGEAFSISSPSTFRSADFQMKEKSSSKTITNPSVATLTNSEKNYLQLNPEKDLWSQVLNIRQLVSRMQTNLRQLNSDVLADENVDLNSHFDLSKELSSEDSYDSADEESIINLEGILVHISTSDSSSSQHQEDRNTDDAYDAASCVSSLGLGGHETTTPMHTSSSIARGNLVSPAYSEGAAAAAASTPIASSRRTFQHDEDMEDDVSSVESLTTMQEFGHFFKIFYFFLLEFPVQCYSILTDSSSTSIKSKTKSPRSSKREKLRLFLYTMLTLFILGCVVWKQCPSCFHHSETRPSQSCVTPTFQPISLMNATKSPADFAAPLLSVHHSTMRSSKMPPLRLSSVDSPSETFQVLEDVAEDSEVDVPMFMEEVVAVQSPQEESIQEPTVPKNPLIRKLQSQGKKLVQKVGKNNQKMWDQYPTTSVSFDDSQEEYTAKQAPLVALQEKGQEVVRKLVHNNDKMWNQYPTPVFQEKKKKKKGGGFLQKTANMWSDKSSDYYVAK